MTGVACSINSNAKIKKSTVKTNDDSYLIEEIYEIDVLNAVKNAMKECSEKIDLLSLHGQTVFHRPKTETRTALGFY